MDVSAAAVAKARRLTLEDGRVGLGQGPGRVSLLSYDALALPAPALAIDFLVDMTVYCSLRHRFLPRRRQRRAALPFCAGTSCPYRDCPCTPAPRPQYV